MPHLPSGIVITGTQGSTGGVSGSLNDEEGDGIKVEEFGYGTKKKLEDCHVKIVRQTKKALAETEDYSVEGKVVAETIITPYNTENLKAILVLDMAHWLPQSLKNRVLLQLDKLIKQVELLPTSPKASTDEKQKLASMVPST